MHLGVTEAGEGEDGRIKSAVGIGTLLEDGLGDTIRVSLTEDPEFEIPVAQELVRRYEFRSAQSTPIEPVQMDKPFVSPINPFAHERRLTSELANFGGHQVPRVIADFSQMPRIQMEDLKAIGHFYLPEPDKWAMNDLGADYIYTGKHGIDFMLPNGLKQIVNSAFWDGNAHVFPLFTWEDWCNANAKHAELNFVAVEAEDLTSIPMSNLSNVVLVIHSSNVHQMAALRRGFFALIQQNIQVPVVIKIAYPNVDENQLQLFAPTDAGGLLIDGFGDGIMLSMPYTQDKNGLLNATAFGILQASRVRISKTEYISCPSCGRTLFDLQETTAKIRQVTDHLKGVKIGIMGCIVNGPGEMADADYGYVGIGKDKIALYKGQEVVKKSVPADSAVDELITLIKENGDWREPSINE
jgi:(E)-4-hydroxy-3-methylbut-2-enyl-diphosphate synthase